jgi:hypothetical protein
MLFFQGLRKSFCEPEAYLQSLGTFSADPTGYPEQSLITLEFISDRSLFSALMQMFEKRV